MRRPPYVVTLLAAFALAGAASALVMRSEREEHGPAKDAHGPPYADPGSAFRLSPLRCYWRESAFDGFGTSRRDAVAAFQGDVDDANAALAAFAALPAKGKVVRVFPGPGSVRSADGKASHPCDWEVRWESNVTFPRGAAPASESHTAVMTLYVARAERVPAADPRAAGWVRDLDDDSYRVREDATRALAGLGEAALPAMREVLAKGPPLEQRRRIERLLARLRPINAHRLRLPAEVRPVSLDGLVRAAAEDWRSGDPVRSWQAASRLAEWAERSEEALPPLVEALSDRREQVRGRALAAFQRLGGRGGAALGKLRAAAAAARDPAALDALKKATLAAGGGSEGESAWRENRRLRASIDEYCRGVGAGPGASR